MSGLQRPVLGPIPVARMEATQDLARDSVLLCQDMDSKQKECDKGSHVVPLRNLVHIGITIRLHGPSEELGRGSSNKLGHADSRPHSMGLVV